MGGKRKKGRLYDHGLQLKKLREQAGLTQPEAARVTSISWQTLANVESDKIGIKLDDLNKLLVLYKSHYAEKAEKQKNSLSNEERTKLFDDTKNLAFYFVNKYYDPSDRWCEKQDLEQIALMALWKAACYCDPENEYQFGTYAARLIKGELVDYLYVERQARKGASASATTLTRAYKVRRLIDEGYTEEKVAAELGLGVRNVIKLYELAQMRDYEQLNTSDDDGDEFEGTNVPAVYDEYGLFEEERKSAVANALSGLPEDQREAVKAVNGFEGEPRTVAELAKDQGKSYGTMYKLYHLGMAKLAHPRNSRALAGVM